MYTGPLITVKKWYTGARVRDTIYLFGGDQMENLKPLERPSPFVSLRLQSTLMRDAQHHRLCHAPFHDARAEHWPAVGAWTPGMHAHHSEEFREVVETLMLIWRLEDTALSAIPREILFALFDMSAQLRWAL